MKKRIISLALALGLLLSLAAVPALGAGCPVNLDYNLGSGGVSADLTSESVPVDGKPAHVPEVHALAGRAFVGWSLTDPATLKAGEEAVLVDMNTFRVPGNTTLYAVYRLADDNNHKHYVIGYPNGNFGPADNINRASVATIIARAVLSDFVEGADYGNPGNYTDVSGHWAESAIAYCSKFGVFKGYQDGTFKPNQPITRQELALVIARLDGVLPMQEVPFTDIDEAGTWARDGIYTAYIKGYVKGYEDKTFKPLNNIRRDETVAIFNRYLGRGVDEHGLAGLRPYAAGSAGDGDSEYLTWPDVPQTQWAYYEIIEASNDHQFYFAGDEENTPPEHWTRCWIDEQWRRN